MTEDEFWELVATLGGEVEEARFDALTARLATEPPDRIVAFARRLDQVLRRLDLIALWGQQVWDTEDDLTVEPPPLDKDGFLDARAAVVCAGRSRYTEVLAAPLRFSGVWNFAAETLLYVPVEAYVAATGQHWPYVLPGTERFVTPDELAPDDSSSNVDGLVEQLPSDESVVTVADDIKHVISDSLETGDSHERWPEAADEQIPTEGRLSEFSEFETSETEDAGPVSPAVGSTIDPPPKSVSSTISDRGNRKMRLEIDADTYRLVDVLAAYDAQPLEGFLAEPAPTTELVEGDIGEWPKWMTELTFAAAATRISQVLRHHGGLTPLRLPQLWIVLSLAADWDLTLRLRPHSGAVHVSSTAVQSWDRPQATRAVTALAAHVVLEVFQDYEIAHPAIPDLTALRHAATDLILFPD